MRLTIHIALLGCLLLIGCDRQSPAPAPPASSHDEQTPEQTPDPTHDAYVSALIAWHDLALRQAEKIDWLERVARAEVLDRTARDAWLDQLYTRIERLKSDDPGSALLLPQTGITDPLLMQVVGELVHSDDGVVRYAAARCLLSDLPEAEAGLDMAAYWLGEAVERYRGPRVDRGFVTMDQPEAAVVMLLARARMKTDTFHRDSGRGLTPQQQGVGLMRIAGWAFDIDTLAAERAWLERPLRWLPPQAAVPAHPRPACSRPTQPARAGSWPTQSV